MQALQLASALARITKFAAGKALSVGPFVPTHRAISPKDWLCTFGSTLSCVFPAARLLDQPSKRQLPFRMIFLKL